MSSPLLPGERRRSSVIWWQAAFWVPGLLLLLVLVGSFVFWRVNNVRKIRKEEAAIQQRGEPLTLEDLARNHGEIPEAENAAVLMLDLWESEAPEFWRAFRNGARKLPERPATKYDPAVPIVGPQAKRVPRDQPLSAEAKSAAESLMAEKATHREAVRAALLRPKSRFPLRWGDGYSTLLPHLAVIKGEAQLLQLESVLATDQGEVSKALKALENLSRLTGLLADEPILISQLVRISSGHMLLDGLERLMNQASLSASQLRQVEAMLQPLDLQKALSKTLQTERVLGQSVFNLPAEELATLGDDDQQQSEDSATSAEGIRMGIRFMRYSGIADVDRRFMLETLGQAIEWSEEGTPESLRRTEELIEGVPREAKRFPPKIFSRMLLPSLSKAATRFAQFEARRRAALTALAIEGYRLEHGGQLPESLADLPSAPAAELRLDPFDGKPLRFGKRPKGFVVYSVGLDRTDEGGREKPVKSPVGSFDVTFFVER